MAASVVYTNFGGQLVSEDRGGVKRDYVSDTLGSTIALMDDTGAITDEWKYWPYGEVASRTGTNPTPFTFVGTLGYFKDLVSNLTYVRARFYQAVTGQWMTKDPLWPRLWPYSYSPINYADPLGLDPPDSPGGPRGSGLSMEACCGRIAGIWGLLAGLGVAIPALIACIICIIFSAGTCILLCGFGLLGILIAAGITSLIIFASCMKDPELWGCAPEDGCEKFGPPTRGKPGGGTGSW